MSLPRSTTSSGCLPRKPLSACRKGDHRVALGDAKRAHEISTQSKGVILEQQNQVVNDHTTNGNSLTNKHWAAFDLGNHGSGRPT